MSVRWGVLVIASMVVLGACSDNTADATQRERDRITSATDQAGARGTAEALRAQLGHDTGDLRSMTTLQNAIDALPGSPTFTRIADADHDSLDDDGLVETKFGTRSACLRIPVGTAVTGIAGIHVTDGRCP